MQNKKWLLDMIGVEQYLFFSTVTLNEYLTPEIYGASYNVLFSFNNQPWVVFNGGELFMKIDVEEHITNHS